MVDDGIVVTENIYKKMEKGMNKWQAALEGSKEIYFAVIATSITLAVVFLPIVFMQGFVGRLFREFGIVVAGAVLISAFVSLTLTPVLNVKLSKKNPHKHSWFYNKTEPFFRWMENSYQSLLKRFMGVRKMAWILVGLCVAAIFFVGRTLKSELAPMEDRSQFRLSLSAPEGTSFDAMDKFVTRLSDFVLDSVPEKQLVLTVTSPGFTGSGNANTGFVRVTLVPPNERSRSQKEIVDMVNKNLPKFNEGRAFAIEEQTISVSRRGGQPVSFVVQNNDFSKLTAIIPKILEETRQSTVLLNADVDLKFNKPELRVIIDRIKAAELGVTVNDISQTLQLAYSNRRLGFFTKDGKQYQVLTQVARNDRDEPNDMKTLFVRNNRNEMISLDNLVTTTESNTPPTIYHFNRYKSFTVSAGLQPGKTVGEGIEEMEKIADKLLDETFATSLSGSSRDFQESSSNTSFAFLLALLLIFLILAAQFESFVDPLIIMFTVLLAIAGAVLSLMAFWTNAEYIFSNRNDYAYWLSNKEWNSNRGICKSKPEKGMSKTDAVIFAATQRLRPILMTSLAMSLGALPLALSLGASSTSRMPLGIVIVGGIMFSLVLTLLVIPAMYSFLSTKKKKSEIDKYAGVNAKKESSIIEEI